MYKRSYSDVTVTLIATVEYGTSFDTVSYEVIAKGYKDLSSNIASGYAYLPTSSISNNVFTTLDIIYCAFAMIDASGNITGETSSFFTNVSNYVIPKAHENGCWVILSISPESSWSTFANPSNDLLDTVATNIVNVINTYGFDGVDIDWEYPLEGQYTWFTSLVSAVRTKVKANNSNHLVTAAIAGGKLQPAYYDLVNSKQYLDYINVMCYSLSRLNGQYQSALYKRNTFNDTTNKVGDTLASCSVDETAQLYLNTYGIPYSKLIIGLPFYGIKQTRTNTDGVWSSWAYNKALSYTEITSSYLNNTNYTYVYDNISKVPYLIKNDGTEFIQYENALSISEKCKYITDNGLAGVMYWQNSQDTTGDLLNAIKTGMSK